MNPENIHIREYKKEDYKALLNLWQETDLGNPARGDNHQIIQQSINIGGKLFILEYDNKIIGTSWITFDGRRLHMHHFGIHPKFQNKGFGKTLLKNCLEFAKEKGYQIKLEVHKDNLSAINLYTNAGFNFLGDYDLYIIRNLDEV